MDWIINNYQIIIAAIIAIFTTLKWVTAIKFVNFAEKALDTYADYDKFEKDGKWVDEEYTEFGKDVVEMIHGGKGLLKK